MSDASEKTVSLKLTPAEFWALDQAYTAAFVDPSSRNEAEVSVADKITNLSIKMRKSARKAQPFRSPQP